MGLHLKENNGEVVLLLNECFLPRPLGHILFSLSLSLSSSILGFLAKSFLLDVFIFY